MGSIVSQLLLKISSDTAELVQGLNQTKGKVDDFQKGFEKLKDLLIEAFAVEKIVEYGEKLVEYAEKVNESTEKVEAFSHQSGEALDTLSGKIQATSDVFGTDFNTTLQATNVLVQQGGETWSNASDLIAKGVALNHTQADSFMNLIREFTPTFAAMGYSGEQSVVLISEALKKGFGEDLGAALNKFHTNIEELSPKVRDALQGIGVNADELVIKIREGSLTEREALDTVTDHMKRFGNNSGEVAAVVAEVFGKAGKKMGASMIESLGHINLSMKDLVANATEGEKAQLRLVDSTAKWDAAMSSLFGNTSGFMANLKADLFDLATNALQFMIEKTVSIVNGFIDLYNNSLLVRGLFQNLIFVVKELWENLKLVFNVIGDVFNYSARLIKDLVTLNFKDLQQNFQDAFVNIAKDAVTWGKNTYDNFREGVNDAVNSKPLELIKLNDVEKQGEEGGKRLATKVSESFNKNVHYNLPDGTDPTPLKSVGKGNIPQVGGFGGKLAIDPTGLKNAMGIVIKETKNYNTLLDKVGSNFNENIEKKGTTAFTKIGETIGQMTQQGKSDINDLTTAALNSAKSFIAMQLAQAIAGAIKEAVASYPPPYGEIIAGGATALVTGLFASIPSFESGVDNFSGGWAQINEHGRGEIVNLPNGSSVIPHDLSRSVLNKSSSSNPVQINLSAKVSGRDLLLVSNETNRIIKNSR